MALSKRSVDTAWTLFRDILYAGPRPTDGDRIINSFIGEYEDTEENKSKRNFVFGEGLKSDGGWECVFINIRDISADQIRLWTEGNGNIPNTAFSRSLGNGITRLGFF
jgi:hypothetical protein